jgi:hypothetical protein
VVRRGQRALRGQRRLLRGAQRADDAAEVAGAEVFVDFGNLRTQLLGIALREAADDEEPFDAARRFRGGGPEDQVDRLLLRIADEAAGVDDDHLRVGAVAVEDHAVAGRLEACHEVFAVHGVLRTAEGYDVDLFHSLSFGLSGAAPRPMPSGAGLPGFAEQGGDELLAVEDA